MSRSNAIALSVVVLLMSSGAASARVMQIESNLNLREGPGPNQRVIAVIPARANVMVGACDTEWCQVTFGGRRGFASRVHLGGADAAFAAAPPATVAPVPSTRYDPDDSVRVWQWDDREWRDRHWREQGIRRRQ